MNEADSLTVQEAAQEPVSRLMFVAYQYIPQFLSRGLSSLPIPPMVRPLVKGLLKDPLKMTVSAVSALMKHATEDRLMTAEEMKAQYLQLRSALDWAYAPLLAPENPGVDAKTAWTSFPDQYAQLIRMAQGTE